MCNCPNKFKYAKILRNYKTQYQNNSCVTTIITSIVRKLLSSWENPGKLLKPFPFWVNLGGTKWKFKHFDVPMPEKTLSPSITYTQIISNTYAMM